MKGIITENFSEVLSGLSNYLAEFVVYSEDYIEDHPKSAYLFEGLLEKARELNSIVEEREDAIHDDINKTNKSEIRDYLKNKLKRPVLK